MVQFFSTRRPEESVVFVVSTDRVGRKAVLRARPRKVRDAAAYWLESNEMKQHLPGRDFVSTVVKESGGLYFAAANIEVTRALFNDNRTGSYNGVFTVKAQDKDQGTLVGIDEDIPDQLADTGSVKDYDGPKITEDLYDWLTKNKRRVTLGYGPQYPLDDINPLSVSEDYIPREDTNIVENFSEWLRSIAEDTILSSNEHAFYVDENNNTIGVIAGGRSRVQYPSSKKNATSVGAHTHPTIKSLGFPSDTDLNTNAFRCNDDSINMILSPNAHTNFYLNEVDKRDDHPEMAMTQYPFTEVPVTIIKRDQALTESELKDHHADQEQKIRAILDQELGLKDQGISQVQDELSDAAFSLLESEFDKALMLRDKLVDENKAIEALNDRGIEHSLKYTIEQEPLQL